MNLFDIRTIVFTYAISNAVCLVVIASLWRRNRKRFAGLGFWLADYAMQFTVILLVALRGIVPDFASIVVSNGLAITGTILLYVGLERFVGKRASQVHNYFLLAVFVFVHWYFAFVQPSLLIRTINLSVGLILICSQCAWLLIRRVEADMRPITLGVGYVFIAFSLFSIARIVVDLIVDPGNNFFQTGIYEALAVLTNQTLFIILTFSLLLMFNRRVVMDLERDIIERGLAEAALHNSEGRFRSLFENMLSGYAYCKMIYEAGQPQDFIYLETNSAFATLTGLKDVLGKRVTEVIPGIRESNPELFEIYGRVAMTGEPEKFETYVDALGIWFSVSVYSPEREHFVAVFENITERKRAEEALQRSEALLLQTGEIAKVGGWEIDLLTMTPQWSLETYRIHEVDPSLQPDLENAINYYAPEARPVIREAVQRAIQEGQSYDLELPIVTAKGKPKWIRTMGQPEFRDSKCVRLFGTFQDITERKQAEEALRRFELLSEHSRDIILFMRREDGRILEANTAAARAYGYSRDELLALAIQDLRAPHTRNLTADQMARADDGGIIFETVHLRKDGSTFPVEVSSQGANIGGVRALVSIIRDITERKRAEEEIASLSKFPTENPDPVLRAQNDGRLTYANAASRELLEMWGCEINAYLPAKIKDMLAVTVESGSVKTVDVPCKDKVYALMLVPIVESGYVNLYARDITARLRVEQALFESEEKYRLLADNSNDWIYWIQPDRSFRYVSPSCERVTGFAPMDFMANPHLLTEIVHPEDRQRVEAHSEVAERDSEADNLEFRIITIAGEVRWLSHICAPVYTADGEYIGRSGTNRDITERKQAEEQLAKIAKRLSLATSSAGMGIWDWDIQKNELAWDGQMYALYGLEPGEFGGAYEAWLNGVHPDDRDPSNEVSQQAVRGEREYDTEFRVVRPDGSVHWLKAKGEVFRDEHSQPLRMVGVNYDITERKQAEEALLSSEARYRHTLDAMLEGCQILGFDWRYLYLNDVADRHNRRPKDELLGNKYMDMWPGIESTHVFAVIKQCLEERVSQSMENEFTFPDGSQGWFELRIYPVPEGIVILSVDITERKKAEKTLRQTAEELDKRTRELNAILSSVQEFVYIFDPKGRFVFANKKLLDLWGLTAEQVVGKTMRDLDYPRTVETALLKGVRRVLKTGQPVTNITHYTSPSGGAGSYENILAPMLDPEGKVSFVAGSSRDVTERKQAEQALRESEERLRQIASSLREVIWLRDIQTRQVLYVNPAFEELTGRTCESFLENRDIMIDAIHPDDKEEVVQALEQRLEGVPFDKEHRIIHLNGSVRWVLSRIFPVRNEAGEVYRWASIMEDITERKRSEEELSQTLEELKSSNAELEQFAYVASHDLQEPLRGIAGLAQLLEFRYQGQLDDKANEYIDHIVEGTQRMQTLINDLLAYSRVGRRGEAIRPTEAETALKAALANLNAAILEYGATVINESLPAVRADATQLVQLFQNLIGNAIKFRAERPPRIHVGVTDAGDFWQFWVRDNGIGIEPQYFERIFLVFQRLHTRREYKGTGIGLAICKKIIERHGGQIWVESQVGQGSTFYFTFPKGK
jgi:PAS domain S-box-containing protein